MLYHWKLNAWRFDGLLTKRKAVFVFKALEQHLFELFEDKEVGGVTEEIIKGMVIVHADV